MGITIPEEESELCAKLMRPAWIAAGLTNDLFSWEKEYEAAQQNGLPDVVNAIWVLMGEHSITAEQAKLLCREKIKIAVADYLVIVKENANNTSISLDLRRYIEAMQYSLSGNVIWSLTCPRYHATKQYNVLQLQRMEEGLSAHPKLYEAPVDNAFNEAEDNTSDSETSQPPRKRARTSGVSTPATSVSGGDADSASPDKRAAWAAAANGSMKDVDSVVVALDLPEMGDEVSKPSLNPGCSEA
jgi:Terpene synthase family 2, C-terminal metal binding